MPFPSKVYPIDRNCTLYSSHIDTNPCSPSGLRAQGDAILVAFALANGEFGAGDVEIFDTQAEALHSDVWCGGRYILVVGKM
jgi:hypothetical protein